VITRRQFDLLADLRHRVFNRAIQIAAPDVECDANVAAVAFSVDVVSAIANFDGGELGQGDPLSRRREQTNVTDGLGIPAIRLLVTHHYVIAFGST
jgi:hypothetical protein